MTESIIKPIAFRDPAAAFAPLATHAMAVFLDSALPGKQGRYAYIAVDPFRVIACTPAPWRVSIADVPQRSNPFTAMAAELARYRTPGGPTPFSGGAIGFFSYELGGTLETLSAPKDTPWPMDMVVGLYDTVAAFDLAERKAWVIAHDLIPGRPSAAIRAEALAAALGTAMPTPAAVGGSWEPETTQAQHQARIEAAIEAIRRGDIYQANITQKFTAQIPADADSYRLYLRLRAGAPGPFGAFINAGNGFHILSASPERFLALSTQGDVETRPIKGTRPRGATPGEDAALAQELQTSGKDRAENLMIVDLLRNDLARVCVPGSIEVPVLCGLESFPAVHHLVSVVTGQLREDASAVDLLRAAFPGGSITGAPKIKAMEVIHDLEPGARGPYCGAIAWLGFDGAMDSSIVIRTLVRNGTTLIAQAGGGIVADSNPAREYEESVIKVKPLLNVLARP